MASRKKTTRKQAKDFPDLEIADYLRDEKDIAEFLSSITSDPDSSAEEVIAAIGHVAKARGISKVAEDSGLQRESVYKILRPGSKPQFSSVYSILKSMGVRIVLETGKGSRN